MTDRTISTLLQDIKIGKIVLPEIQRDYVWSEQKARDLIDSLYHKYPIGNLLFWRPENGEITVYKLLIGQKNPTNHPEWYVLDGQQRLTSLHLISLDPNTENRSDTEKPIKIRLNLDEDVFSIENNSNKNDPKWILVSDVWSKDSTDVARELAEKLDYGLEEVYKKYVPKIQRLKAISERTIPVLEIRESDYDRITEIYVRLNEKGTKLKKAEINLALIVLKFPNFFFNKLTKLSEKYDVFDFDYNFFLRCFVCLSTDQSKYEPLKKYLDNATEDIVTKNLDDLDTHLKKSLNFIKSHFGISYDNYTKLIPSNIVLVALVMYYSKKHGRVPTESELNLLKLWFFAASHYSRYSMATETALNADLKSLMSSEPLISWIDNIKHKRNSIKMREFKGRINNTNRFALNYALKLTNALDWWEGTKIEDLDNIEFHHIFPKKILRDNGYPDTLINDIRNIAIVSHKANRSISSKSPAKYFDEDIGDMNRVYSQFVPTDSKYWQVENYHEFLEKREEMIIEKINQNLSELYDTQ